MFISFVFYCNRFFSYISDTSVKINLPIHNFRSLNSTLACIIPSCRSARRQSLILRQNSLKVEKLVLSVNGWINPGAVLRIRDDFFSNPGSSWPALRIPDLKFRKLLPKHFDWTKHFLRVRSSIKKWSTGNFYHFYSRIRGLEKIHGEKVKKSVWFGIRDTGQETAFDPELNRSKEEPSSQF
jgi:hypothetical protein